MASPLSGYVAVSQIVDTAGPGQPFYAPASGGGGGGGGGPNLVCSTLTTNSGDGTWGGVADINPQSQQFGIGNSTITQFNNWGDLAGDVAYTIGATTTAQIDFQFNISTVNPVVPPITEEGTYLQIYSDSGNTTGGILSMGAQPDGTGYVAVTSQGTPTVSTLFLVANQVKIFPEGDLVVSSINGLAPGGGGSVPPNLVVSSIQPLNLSDDLAFVGSGGIIVFDQQGDQNIKLNTGTFSSEIGTRSIGGNPWLSIGGPEGGLNIPVSISSLNCAGSEFGDIAVSTLTVSSINGAQPGGGGGPPPAIVSTISSLVNVSTINSGSPGILNVLGGMVVSDNIGTGTISTIRVDSLNPGSAVTISSLNVALLNGAPPATGGAQFSSIGIPGGPGASTFQLTQSATNLLVSFSTVAGHSYSASIGARAQLQTVPADTDIIYSEVLDNGAGNEVIGLWPLSQVSTFSAGFNQEVGGTVNWKAGGTGVAFSLYPTASGATARVDRLVVIDFGAI